MENLFSYARSMYKKSVLPSGKVYHVWLAVVSVAVVYNLVAVIARFSFPQLQNDYWALWVFLDCVFDAIYILDIQIKLRTAYFDDGMLVGDIVSISEEYTKSFTFLIDVFSIFPIDLLMYKYIENTTFLRFNRIFRFGRMLEFFSRIENWVQRPQLYRILNLVLYIVILLHWNACFYILMSAWIGFGSDDWVYFNISDPEYPGNASLSRMYIYSFYWSTLTLSTIGDVGMPVKNVEFIFMICNFLVGVLVFATIVGHVNDMLHSLAAEQEEFRSKLDGVKYYMRNKNVSENVQKYLAEWFEYLWQTNKSLHLESKLEHLPDRLQAKIKLDALNQSLSSSIFRNCGRKFLEEFSLKLRHDVFSPGEYICRKGDIGREMYLITKGSMKVKLNGITKFLPSGTIFGEISLLDIPENVDGHKRTADVWSVGFSDVFIMDKDDLDGLLNDFPDVRETLTRKALMKLIFSGRVAEKKTDSAKASAANDASNRVTEEENGDKKTSGETLAAMQRKIDDIADKLRSAEDVNERLAKVEDVVKRIDEGLQLLISHFPRPNNLHA